MILPEHKEQYLIHRRSAGLATRPELDEQQLLAITERLLASFSRQTPVTLRLWEDGAARAVTGIVARFDQLRRQIKLKSGEDEDGVWIRFGDMIDAD